MKSRKWTTKECEYLEEKWGLISIETIAKNLKRTTSAVVQKANSLNLGAYLENGQYITFNQLIKTLGITGGPGYRNISWIKNRDFPIRYKIVKTNRFKVVYLNDFWHWADKNRNMINWSKVEKNILGAEPEWVDEQRKIDYFHNSRIKNKEWTKEDDESLKSALRLFKYNYIELSEMFCRSESAIQSRILYLELKERPIPLDKHIKWTKAEIKKLTVMIKERYTYEIMSYELGKSSKAIRNKVYSMYLTENLDKVSNMLGNGLWGHGRPDISIMHRFLNKREKRQVKKNLIKFIGILKGLESRYNG